MVSCLFFDERTDFFRVVEAKLGAGFTLADATSSGSSDWQTYDVAIVRLAMPATADFESRMAVLRNAVLNPTAVPVVVFLPFPDRELMRMAITAGAYDSFVETGSMEELRIVLRRAAQYRDLNREIARLNNWTMDLVSMPFVTTDPKMLDVLQFARKIALTDASILITGETGTGKELLTRAIHNLSPRSKGPFVAVACSSLPESLIEAELFGHEKGAFTGATTQRKGRFESAQGGTIFLDEVGELSPALQVKLLRVLQERTFERIGSSRTLPMDARVICATNRNMRTLLQAGQFRPDLYYRLNTIEIALSPLRERRCDIVPLANVFLTKCAESCRRPARRISVPVLIALQEYDWPGNARELQHIIERAVLICDGPDIHLEHIPPEIIHRDPGLSIATESYDSELRKFKRALVMRALEESGNNKVLAAHSLRISRSSLHRLIDQLDVTGVKSSGAA
jgi:DNA-binding NtrC family response regulator